MELTAEGLDRLDYFWRKFKKHGVYFGWSHTYGFRVRPGNSGRCLAYDEIARNLHGNTYGLHQLRRRRAGPDDRDGGQSAGSTRTLYTRR